MRYIDADKLQEAYKEIHGGKRSLLIDTEPTVDVVEVVRCKDCKHFDEDIQGTGLCSLGGQLEWAYMNTMYADDFCSYGERAK